MNNNVLKFVVGEGFPGWFNDEVGKGRARINYDENNNLVNITLFTVSKQIIANKGDVIVKTNTGMSLIPDEKAVKYRIKKRRNNK